MSDRPSFSIVVPTFHRPDALHDTLAGLLALDYEPSRYEVVVIDDGSDDVTAEVVNRFRGRGVELTLEAQHQQGAASARNRGARLSCGELLLFCDDDMIVEPSHLKLHAAAHREHETAVVSGMWEFAPAIESVLRRTAFGRYRIELERHYQRGVGGEPLDDDSGCLKMPLVGAANLTLKRDLFWEIGGFDEEFPVAGAEDQDFSLRARSGGALLLLDTNIRCFQNDNRLTLAAYCAREERNAETMPFLARKYPADFSDVPYVRENRPIQAGDPPRIVAKKLLKSVLASGVCLAALHRLVAVLETARFPDRILRRIYRGLLGLHLFRGFRRTWRN
jgi:GT2 family glycosyltransferase